MNMTKAILGCRLGNRQRTNVTNWMNIFDGKNHKNRTSVFEQPLPLWNQALTVRNNCWRSVFRAAIPYPNRGIGNSD